jgi:hypothetical protein
MFIVSDFKDYLHINPGTQTVPYSRELMNTVTSYFSVDVKAIPLCKVHKGRTS